MASIAVTATIAYLVGFGLGFWLFKRSRSWCRTCGSVLSCADCTRAGRSPARGRL